ncbi:hypothetical protein RBH20_19815 [Haloarcula sp. H-GB4]|uniref:hypothetical protein n=1 Tax=Haloarcula sp. H-GB4 TaxID=3069755 RepID=UPI0027B43719|nr:hypothetical protein [Haloarcula sp. H-GB4]MDQ2074778.1 hypothetical protein [Haloarcula sp. H-GB4]
MSNSSLAGAPSRTFADQLLVANSPDAVATVLEELESDYNVVWQPLGNDENNYSDVYTQAASPIPAFCELPLNSEDSQMLRFYDEADGVDPDEYTSMKAAVEADWVDLDDAEIEIIADGLKPSDGNLLNLTVRDNGKGKGRSEFEDFIGLHAPGLKKQDYGFLQGQYGMGSTAVMQFAGNIQQEYNERAYKFIASASTDAPGEWTWTLIRNNPHRAQVEYLTVGGEFPVFDGTFGEAMVEKYRDSYPDKYDFEKQADAFDPQKHGAFVKVYDYQTTASRALISGYEGFRKKLERCIVDSPFPIRLTDMRYESKLTQSTTRGLLPAIRDGNEHLLKGEEHITTETGSETLGERDIHVLLFRDEDELEDIETTTRGKSDLVAGTSAHKNAASRAGIQRDHALMLTINGQTHGSKGERFLKRLGYSKVAGDTVVIVEFDDLANLGMVNMFSPSRDSLKDSPQANRFTAALEDALEDSDLLSDEEDRRRAQRGSEEIEVDTETFSEFVADHPEFANYIATGTQVSAPRIRPSDLPDDEDEVTDPADDSARSETDAEDGEETTDSTTEPPKLPTYLRPIREYDPAGDHEYWDERDGIMPVEMPVNSRTVIRFETDAQSNYLVREVLGGSLTVSPSARFEAVELQDGLLSLTLSPAEDATVGDDFGMTIELTRPDPTESDLYEEAAEAFPAEQSAEESLSTDGGAVNTGPLTSMFTVEYTEREETDDQTPTPGSDDDDSPDGDHPDSGEDSASDEAAEADKGDSETTEMSLAMPDINIVHEENWRVDDSGDPMDPEEFKPGIAADFDEQRLLQVDESRDGTISGLTLTINMDAATLRSFIVEQNVSDTWKPFVENQYRLAVVFYAICEFRSFVDQYGQTVDGGELMTAELVDRSINALGPALMPTIIPEDQLDRITE